MINQDRGFGFIRREGSPDLFFHVSECVSKEAFAAMNVGDEVLYDTGDGKRGEEGRDIQPV